MENKVNYRLVPKTNTRKCDRDYNYGSHSTYQIKSGREYGLFDSTGHEIFKCRPDEGYDDGNYGW